MTKYDKMYYTNNREKILKRMRDYRESDEYKNSLGTQTLNRILASIKSRCKKRGIEFNLEASKLIIPVRCPYLKVPLTEIQGKGFQPFNISIDRIDATKGYTHDNVEIISRKANVMKQNASKKELLTFAKSVLEKFQ